MFGEMMSSAGSVVMTAGFNVPRKLLDWRQNQKPPKRKPSCFVKSPKVEKVKVLFWLMAQVSLPE